ncbi:MAG TPA: four helix bundle protein [Kiritimatiellia bacterium]|nr:four helix bundle protein [Kiritimatiellia bacterium]
MTPQHRMLDHEKLRSYQLSLELVGWLEPFWETIPSRLSVKDQLDRASTSIPLNIAEGNGKYTGKDRCHYFDIARGSALECAPALDVLNIKKLLSSDQLMHGKEIIAGIISTLVGLIKNNSGYRLHEEHAEYETTPRGD